MVGHLHKQSSRRKTVIVADGNPDFRNVLSMLLGMDFDVVECDTGREMLLQVKRWRPDFVLMESELGGELDGLEALRVIRGNSDIAATRVAIVSIDDRPESIDAALDLGVEAYFVKPFSLAVIDHWLSTVPPSAGEYQCRRVGSSMRRIECQPTLGRAS